MWNKLFLVCRAGDSLPAFFPKGKRKCHTDTSRLLLCCVQEKSAQWMPSDQPTGRKMVCQVISVWLKSSREGVMSFGRGDYLSFLWYCIRGEKDPVADRLKSLCLPYQFLVPTHYSYLHFPKALSYHFVLLPWYCTSQVNRRPICVPEMTPAPLWRGCKGCWASNFLSSYWLQRPSLVLSPADSTLWRLLLSHLF